MINVCENGVSLKNGAIKMQWVDSVIQTALVSYTDGKTRNFTYRNFKYCYIQVMNTNGADQTARICI